MRSRKIVLPASLFILGVLSAPIDAADPPKVLRADGVSAPSEKITIGRAENVGVPAIDDVLKARIDTGAKSTSIYAVEVEEFERDGKAWVRFVVKNPDAKKQYRLERRVTRVIRIKGRAGRKSVRRPSVAMDIVIGKVRKRVSVNLADRTGFEFPLLIGRDFLSGSAVVDVSLEYTQTGADRPDSKPTGKN